MESCGGCVFRCVVTGSGSVCSTDSREGDELFVVGAWLFAQEVLLRETLPAARKGGAENLLRGTCAEPTRLGLGIFGVVVKVSARRELVWW